MVAVIYEPSGLRVSAVCDGPDASGACPRALADGRAYCAGLDIVLSRDVIAAEFLGHYRPRLMVSPEAMACPIAPQMAPVSG